MNNVPKGMANNPSPRPEGADDMDLSSELSGNTPIPAIVDKSDVAVDSSNPVEIDQIVVPPHIDTDGHKIEQLGLDEVQKKVIITPQSDSIPAPHPDPEPAGHKADESTSVSQPEAAGATQHPDGTLTGHYTEEAPLHTGKAFTELRKDVAERQQRAASPGSSVAGTPPPPSPTPPPALMTSAAQYDEYDGDTDNMSVADTTTATMLEIDSQDSDGDSALGDMIRQESTASVRSSIYDYIHENGRTYHAFKNGIYMFPNDDQEQERLDLQHHLFALTFEDNLHLAPLPEKLHNVLDIATGTGIWAIDFANKYPQAKVIGTDLSPIQPLYVPPNCQFEVSDAEDEWHYSYQFDYVHGRALMSCFTSHATVIQHAFDALRPGGYFELQDPVIPLRCIDDSLEGTSLQRWAGLLQEGAGRLGRRWTASVGYKRFMHEAGFVDLVERHFEWPLNTWPRGKHHKLLGLWFMQDMLDGLQGMSMAVLTRGLGWTPEQVEVLLVEVRKDIRNKNIHAYLDIMVVYGRKPEF